MVDNRFYVIPNFETVILGGTAQQGDWTVDFSEQVWPSADQSPSLCLNVACAPGAETTSIWTHVFPDPGLMKDFIADPHRMSMRQDAAAKSLQTHVPSSTLPPLQGTYVHSFCVLSTSPLLTRCQRGRGLTSRFRAMTVLIIILDGAAQDFNDIWEGCCAHLPSLRQCAFALCQSASCRM